MSTVPRAGSRARELADQRGDAPGQRHAARVDAHQGQPVGVGVALHDLVGDARHRATQLVLVDQDRSGHAGYVRQGGVRGGGQAIMSAPFRPLGTGLKVERVDR